MQCKFFVIVVFYLQFPQTSPLQSTLFWKKKGYAYGAISLLFQKVSESASKSSAASFLSITFEITGAWDYFA